MPLYEYRCKSEGCSHKTFTIFTSIAEYQEKPTCPDCEKNDVEPVYNLFVARGENITLGTLAERNAAKLGEEGMARLKKKHNAYKDQRLSGPLPEGMSHVRK